MQPWTYVPNFIAAETAQQLLLALIAHTPWQQHEIFIYGRRVKCPRLSAWYGDDDARYTYSGYQMQPLPWTDELLAIKARVESYSATAFNSVLLNYYRNGSDSMGCHSDDEKEHGVHPVIASVNLGAERDFVFKEKSNPVHRVVIPLAHASLLLMHAGCQEQWQHSVPQRKRVHGPRINLTIRHILNA